MREKRPAPDCRQASCRQAGFTLIEVIVVISLIGVIGFILTDVLTQTLRGQNKVKILNQIKQNGQVSLSRISNDIRQSEKVVCIGTGTFGSLPIDTMVLFREGTYLRYRYYSPKKNDSNIPIENGFIAWDNPPEESDPADLCTNPQRFDRRSTPTPTISKPSSSGGGTFLSTGGTSTPIPTPTPRPDSTIAHYLTDKEDTINGVSIEPTNTSNQIFWRQIEEGYKDIITIKFRAKAGVNAGITSEFNVGDEGVLFETSAQVRGDKK